MNIFSRCEELCNQAKYNLKAVLVLLPEHNLIREFAMTLLVGREMLRWILLNSTLVTLAYGGCHKALQIRVVRSQMRYSISLYILVLVSVVCVKTF